MSQRVMNILGGFSPRVEVYSIDEAFVDLGGMGRLSLKDYGHKIKERVLKYTGLPVGVGIAPTKTLAKVANRLAKKTIINKHVYVIDSEEKRLEALAKTSIKDVWGIGRQHAKRLNKVNVGNALEFTELPLSWVRKQMTVVGERTWRELRGEACLEIQLTPKPKKGIGTAKSFGIKLQDLERMEEACAYYISEVGELLRAQKSCASQLQIFITTNYHSNLDKQYSNSRTIFLETPTNNSFTLISTARKALRNMYRSGYRYKKVGVNLTGIIPQEYVQANLFHQEKPNAKKLMATIDSLNEKYGKASVSSAMLGTRHEEWGLIKKERSPRYTTQWGELMTIKAGNN